MKEATGELNMTVVTVVAIAAVAAFFYAFVWPGIKSSITNSTKCANAVNCTCTGDTCTCNPIKEDGSVDSTTINCPNTNKTNNAQNPAGGGFINTLK